MEYPSVSSEPEPLERWTVEVFSELSEETIARRSREVNVLLRMSMLAGVEMELASTLNLLCDMAGEIVTFRRAAVYFWEEDGAAMNLRVTRNMSHPDQENSARANVLNYWVVKLAPPLLLNGYGQPEADALLRTLDAASILVVPLFMRNRIVGTLQLFGERTDSFSREDVQLLWILSLIAESMLARDYSNESLLRFAFTDFLTGLRTRGYFEQQLSMEMARAERRETPLAVLMIDIDHFKHLNDTFGHHVGDVVLRDLASILTRELREIDTAARYGGEEFILLLPETNLQGASLVAQRLLTAVEQASFFTAPGQTERVTISIGVSLFPEEAHVKADLLEAADIALYQAKAEGRNRVVLYADLKNHKEAS